MGRLPFIIAIFLVGITAKTISPMIVEKLIAMGFLMPQQPSPDSTVIPIPVVEYKKSWKCPDCSESEQYVLGKLQEKTKITDRNALATIMGNIKQESKFISNICEGGARVSYKNCNSGGYGLIQWTSAGRYKGLGSFANKYGCDPSTLQCQTRYMINENIFQRYLPEFEGQDFTISQYMAPAYYWLGWGIEGNRELYAYDYSEKFILS